MNNNPEEMSAEELLAHISKLQQLAASKIEEDKKKKEEEAKKVPVTVTVTQFQFNTSSKKAYLTIKLSAKDRLDITTLLSTLEGYHYSTYSNHYIVEYEAFKNIFIPYAMNREVNGFTINIQYPKDTEDAIREYNDPATYKVSLGSADIILTYSPRVYPSYRLSDIPGKKLDTNKRQYLFPKAEGWRLYEVLNEIISVDNKLEISYSPECLTFLSNEASKRIELNTIAQQEVYAPYKDLDMNGWKLRDFQTVGVRFGELANGRFIIGDPMGSGKTLQALAFIKLQLQKNPNYRTLIICPAQLLINWYREIKKYMGNDAKVTVYRGTTPTDSDMERMLMDKSYPFTIVTYNVAGKEHNIKGEKEEISENVFRIDEDYKENLWIKLINLAKFDCTVPDEVHYISNHESGRSKGVRNLNSPHIIELSGTLIVNRPTDLWAPLYLIDKSKFPSHGHFLGQYTLDGRTPRNVKELQELMRPIMIRRPQSIINKNLEPINRIIKYRELSDKAQRIYNKALMGVYQSIDAAGDNIESDINNILAKINRLKYICALDNMDYVADLANEIYDSTDETDKHRKVLIGSYFQDLTYGISTRLQPNAECFITRKPSGYQLVSQAERMNMIDRFTDNPNTYHLCASLMATQEGFNITAAGSVITNDLWWTPKTHEQFEGRAYGRMSDSHNINSYYILPTGTVMEYIWELLFDKSNMIREVLDGIEGGRSESVTRKLIDRLKLDMMAQKERK